MAQEIFERVDRKISNYLEDIHEGRLGLPDLQRPFVWNNAKVRDLFDSLFNGLPVGYILLWKAPESYDEKTKDIGKADKQYKKPQDILVDGQQRLTALYSSIYGIEVLDKNYEKRRIKISFNPLDRKFENWNKSTENNKEYIPDISQLFIANRENQVIKFRKDYIKRLNEYWQNKGLDALNDNKEEQIESTITELLNILNATIPSLQIRQSADEEIVAEIFVRINSKGQNLNESDFISTLLSVYNQDIRIKIEQFCENTHKPDSHTSFNDLIHVESQHILRVAAALAFNRARLRYVYQLMRGKNLETEEVTIETREQNIQKFDDAVNQVLNLNHWHEFLNIIKSAGYINKAIVSSRITVVYTYSLYLIAKLKFQLNNEELSDLIKRWFFMASLTNFYNDGTTESIVEQHLNNIKLQNNKNQFVNHIHKLISLRLTNDYFIYTLSGEFDNQRAQGPAWFAFVASQIVLGKKVLFSDNQISSILSPHASGTKTAYDYHHIFPKHFLTKSGITKEYADKRTNFVVLDYQTNIEISDKNPIDYLSKYREKFGNEKYFESLRDNAIPENIDSMNYNDFIEKRKPMMSSLIREAYDKLANSKI
jgi:hypothetical protein